MQYRGLLLEHYFRQLIIPLAIAFVQLSLVSVSLGQTGVAAVWANDGRDKVTRDDLRVSRDQKNVANSVWDGTTIKIFGGLNEVVDFNLILEAPNGANNVSVSFTSL